MRLGTGGTSVFDIEILQRNGQDCFTHQYRHIQGSRILNPELKKQ